MDRLKTFNFETELSDEQQDNWFRWADGSDLHYGHWNDSWREEVVDRMDCGYVDTTGKVACAERI